MDKCCSVPAVVAEDRLSDIKYFHFTIEFNGAG